MHVSLNLFVSFTGELFFDWFASIGSGFFLKAAIDVWLASFFIDFFPGLLIERLAFEEDAPAKFANFTVEALYELFFTGDEMKASMSLF